MSIIHSQESGEYYSQPGDLKYFIYDKWNYNCDIHG